MKITSSASRRVFALMASGMLAFAQQNAPAIAAQDDSVPSFAEVVDQNFSQWDGNGGGVLSKDEIVAAVSNLKVRDEAAAAIAAIELVVRHDKYTLPPITKDYLASSPLREKSDSDEQTDSQDDLSKSEKINHPPAFQPRYLYAMRKLRQTSRDLFPQTLPSFDATRQGRLGDCPFVSTVGAMVYRNPSAVKAMFIQNDNGPFTVTFGGGRSIKIAHLTDADIALWSSAGTNGLWLTILEKAYRRTLAATEHPDPHDRPRIYDGFGNSKLTIEILDGHQTRKVELHKIQPASPQLATLRKELQTAQREHLLVKAGTAGAKTSTPGIPHGHEFAILGYNKEADLVHVWNPWGNDFTLKGSDGLQHGYITKRGEFDIPLKDLIQIFTDVNIESQSTK